MKIAAVLVLGVLMGWLVEWIIDWFYWRGRMEALAHENTTLHGRVTTLEAQRTQAPPPTPPARVKARPDDFQEIHGIGPAFAKRLHEAGIHTFEQLAQLTPADLEKILGKLFKRFFSEENTILAQAKTLAEHKANG